MSTITYAGHCVPARVVSGDYYDFLEAGNGVLAFVLADVSGKGMAAALLMANLQASFRSQSNGTLGDPVTLLKSAKIPTEPTNNARSSRIKGSSPCRSLILR